VGEAVEQRGAAPDIRHRLKRTGGVRQGKGRTTNRILNNPSSNSTNKSTKEQPSPVTACGGMGIKGGIAFKEMSQSVVKKRRLREGDGNACGGVTLLLDC